MNEECPICFEIICNKDVDGLICFTCNNICCSNCCLHAYIVIKNKCPICRQDLKLDEDKEFESLFNIVLGKKQKEYLNLGIVFYKLARKYLNYNLEYAISLYEQAQELGLEIPFDKIADKFYENKEYKNALLWYQVSVFNSKTCFQMAQIYYFLNQEELAIKWYNKSAELGNYNSLTSIGCIYYKNKQFQEAKKFFELGTTFNNSQSIINLAIYYKNIEKDYKKFKKLLLPLSKSNPVAMYNLSIEYFRIGYKYRALRLLNKSASYNYQNSIILLNKLKSIK